MPTTRKRSDPRSPAATAHAALRQRRDVDLGERGERRVRQFIEAATAVFLEKGYRAARLSDIVARAGGSLATLYRAFGDKEGLVHAIMEESIRSFGEGLDVLREPGLPPERALPAAVDRMVSEILSPARIVSHRIVIAEGLAFPELRDWFFEHGVAPAEQRLSEYFERERTAGRLVLGSPTVAADRFYMMVFGGTILRSLNGMVTADDIDEVRAQAREAVAIFLRGALPR